MELVNTEDGYHYLVTTENNNYGGFRIHAIPMDREVASEFCMSYGTLKEFCEDWEDCD